MTALLAWFKLIGVAIVVAAVLGIAIEYLEKVIDEIIGTDGSR